MCTNTIRLMALERERIIVLLNLLYSTPCASRNRSRNEAAPTETDFGFTFQAPTFDIWLLALVSKRWITLVFSQHITTDLVLRFCS